MTIITDEDDPHLKGEEDATCAISGKPIELPCLCWRGEAEKFLFINASAFVHEGTASGILAGYGLLKDLVILLDLAQVMTRANQLGECEETPFDDGDRERYTLNDLLLDQGPEAVRQAILNAKPFEPKP